MREEEACLYWPVKYSSNEARVGGEVGQDMEWSPKGTEHHSAGGTRGFAKEQSDRGGGIGYSFVVWGFRYKFPLMTENNPPKAVEEVSLCFFLWIWWGYRETPDV